MKKRGQAEAVNYFIIAIVIVSMAILGFGLVSSVKEKSCKSELAKFEIDLNGLDKTLKFGSSKDFTYQSPCSADKIYFFDLDKAVNLNFLDNLPLLKDSIKSRVQKNIFVVKDGKIIDSFYAGKLKVGFPGYICFVPKFAKISFISEGVGNAASVFAGCSQPECTYIPVNFTDEEAAKTLADAKNFGTSCTDCQQQITSEFAKFVQTRENVDIFRKYEYCRETQKTNVEILIKPKGKAELKQFKFYESIPKFCIEDLQKYLSAISGQVSVQDNHFVVWSLADVKTDQKLTYVLNTFVSEECKKKITGLGIADLIENGNQISVPEIPITEKKKIQGNTQPSLSGLQDRVVGFKSQEQIVIPDLWQHGNDAETASNELYYSIKSQSNENLIDCSIRRNKELWCATKQNQDSYSDITLEIFDGELSRDSSFRITVQKLAVQAICGDNVCSNEAGESCSNCAIDCGACQINSEFKKLKCEVTKEVCNDWFGKLDRECRGFEERTVIGTCWLGIFGNYKCSKRFLTESCERNPTCSEGTAIEQIPCTLQPQCQNECNNPGEKVCVSGNSYKECSNFNQDSCYEYGTEVRCNNNEICQHGDCIVPEEQPSNNGGDEVGSNGDGGSGGEGGGGGSGGSPPASGGEGV